jgi:hypothetical protein
MAHGLDDIMTAREPFESDIMEALSEKSVDFDSRGEPWKARKRLSKLI